jgi:hypothetical protein
LTLRCSSSFTCSSRQHVVGDGPQVAHVVEEGVARGEQQGDSGAEDREQDEHEEQEEPELAERLGVETTYAKTIKKQRLPGNAPEIFRIGVGRPSKTLPVILGDKTPIPSPRAARENLLRCSFFRRWTGRGHRWQQRHRRR